jgi:GNAT superfamily N-acetyltransferase
MINETEEQYIHDRYGREYLLIVQYHWDDEHSGSLDLEITDGYWPIGKVHCDIHASSKMELCDIRINGYALQPESNWAWVKRQVFRRQRPTVDYQGKGLGTALLQLTIDLARQMGIRDIFGFITHDDLRRKPELVTWYQKHGFQVTKAVPNSRIRAAMDIYLKL